MSLLATIWSITIHITTTDMTEPKKETTEKGHQKTDLTKQLNVGPAKDTDVERRTSKNN